MYRAATDASECVLVFTLLFASVTGSLADGQFYVTDIGDYDLDGRLDLAVVANETSVYSANIMLLRCLPYSTCLHMSSLMSDHGCVLKDACLCVSLYGCHVCLP